MVQLSAHSLANTHLRTPSHRTDIPGMCPACAADCTGPREIGLPAARGPRRFCRVVLASDPLEFTYSNIKGVIFGAQRHGAGRIQLMIVCNSASHVFFFFTIRQLLAYAFLQIPGKPRKTPIIMPASVQ
jgi:hypothetical protein